MTTRYMIGVAQSNKPRELSLNSAVSFSSMEHLNVIQLIVLVLQPKQKK